MEQIFQNISKQMLAITYFLRLGQLLKITLDLKICMWQKLKLEKPNISSKMISKPNVAKVVKTHSKVNTATIEVDNQMAIIQIQVGKNIVEDVLLDRGASVNIIIENLKTKLGLLKPRLAPYHFKMADHSMTKPFRIIKILKIHIHGTPYVSTFIVLKTNVVDLSYFMLLGRTWFKDVKVTYDWENSVITVQGNGTIKIISVKKKLGANQKASNTYLL
jgi:hypothetical protein